MTMLLKFFDFCNKNILFDLRNKYLTKKLLPYLGRSGKVLDLGSSDGKLAKALLNEVPSVEIIGLDTHPQPGSYINVIKYHGDKIPFPDNFFDTVMIIDVLHHDSDYEKVIKEASRVSKKYILIKDHYWKNKTDVALLSAVDYLGNKPYGVSLPFNYYKISEWVQLFNKVGATVIKTEKFRYNFMDPCRHVIFHLELNKK